MHRVELSKRWSPLRALLVAAFAVFAVIGFIGVTTVGSEGAIDSGEHLAYAEYVDAHWRIPTKAENYEYATPPLFQVAAIGAEHLVTVLPSVALELPWNLVTRAVWLLVLAGGLVALTSSRRRLRIAGVVALGLAALWGLDEAISLAKSEPWSAGRLLALACGAGLIAATGLIAREVWPGNTGRAIAAGAFAAAYPVVYRMSILFHPEVQFAVLCAFAIFVVLRGFRSGWPVRLGWVLGALFGAAALTRQPAVLVIVTLGGACLWLGRRSARGFLVRAAVVTVLLAGPWWGYAYHLWGNPLQSNLVPRASAMIRDQPGDFYFGAPLERLVLNPYRPYFSDDLLAKLHAELWSDWFGGIHNWQSPTQAERDTASTQSVLGFFADALAIGGLVLLALPALVRVVRRREPSPADVGLALLGLLALVAFAGFVTMLIRFPQQYDDPIKSSYLLFTTPCWAVFSVAAWSAIRRRHRYLNAVLVLVASAYVVSYGSDLAAALTQPTGPPPAPASFIDLVTSIQQDSPNVPLGTEVDFFTSVDNVGNQTAGGLVLTIVLPPGMHLLGAPSYDRGSGCKGLTGRVVCDLDFLPAQTSTGVRYALEATKRHDLTITANARSNTQDETPANNSAVYTLTPAP